MKSVRRRRRHARPFGGGLVLAALLAAGCARPTGHVSGKVLLPDGKTGLPGGTISFFPTSGKGNPVSAEIQENGTYDLPKVAVGPADVTVNNIDLKEGTKAPIGIGGSGMPRNLPMGRLPKDVSPGGPPKDMLAKMPEKPPGSKAPPKPKGHYVPINERYNQPGSRNPLHYDVQPGDQTYNIELKK